MPIHSFVPTPLWNVLVFIGFVMALLVTIGLAAVYNSAFYGSAIVGGSSTQPPKRNCPACGARVRADRDRCSHCEEPLSDVG